jgi:hypothetical protein
VHGFVFTKYGKDFSNGRDIRVALPLLLAKIKSFFCCPAGFLDWGWQAGCDFVAKTCTAYAAAHPTQQYFCTQEQYSSDNVNTVCTFDGLARAACAETPFSEGCAMKVRVQRFWQKACGVL